MGMVVAIAAACVTCARCMGVLAREGGVQGRRISIGGRPRRWGAAGGAAARPGTVSLGWLANLLTIAPQLGVRNSVLLRYKRQVPRPTRGPSPEHALVAPSPCPQRTSRHSFHRAVLATVSARRCAQAVCASSSSESGTVRWARDAGKARAAFRQERPPGREAAHCPRPRPPTPTAGAPIGASASATTARALCCGCAHSGHLLRALWAAGASGGGSPHADGGVDEMEDGHCADRDKAQGKVAQPVSGHPHQLGGSEGGELRRSQCLRRGGR